MAESPEDIEAAEAFVERHVERALAPYQGQFGPELLAEFADELRCFLLTHPVASRMLARIRPRVDRAVSGDEPAAEEAKRGIGLLGR